MDMTPKEYQQYVQQKSKKSPILKDVALAFIIGGLICVVGQAIQNGEQAKPGKADSKHKVTTDSIGNVAAGNSLAVQAQRRAQNNANPHRGEDET